MKSFFRPTRGLRPGAPKPPTRRGAALFRLSSLYRRSRRSQHQAGDVSPASRRSRRLKPGDAKPPRRRSRRGRIGNLQPNVVGQRSDMRPGSQQVPVELLAIRIRGFAKTGVCKQDAVKMGTPMHHVRSAFSEAALPADRHSCPAALHAAGAVASGEAATQCRKGSAHGLFPPRVERTGKPKPVRRFAVMGNNHLDRGRRNGRRRRPQPPPRISADDGVAASLISTRR